MISQALLAKFDAAPDLMAMTAIQPVLRESVDTFSRLSRRGKVLG